MFEIDWAQKELWQKEGQSFLRENSKLKRDAVLRTSLLYWREHCLECAIPDCYTTCSLYVRRADKKCSRFVYGIYPNPDFNGLFDFGADIRFRRWAKLEAKIYGKSVRVRHHRVLDQINRLANYSVQIPPNGSRLASAARRLNWALAIFGKRVLDKARREYFWRSAPRGGSPAYDEFVLECFSPDGTPLRLFLEYFDGKVRLRHSFDITPGWNFHALPAEIFRLGRNPSQSKITISPENNRECRLVFTWLDFVQYRSGHRPGRQLSGVKRPAPASKVKCVAWDLDNTLWKGILAEEEKGEIAARPEAVDLIKKLDDKGIVQTVVSKNNHDDAWEVIERLGLRDSFLYPAINWAPKSANLKGISQRLNIDLDTFALIDDSPFERAEVQAALPQVRVYSEDQIGQLLTYEEFDVPVTEASRKRSASYQMEIKRQEEMQSFDGDYETFLRDCEMRLRLFIPREEKHILRCFELVQRANQLNLSGKRYTEADFRDLLSHPQVLCLAMECKDRFGDYGIVGFASIDEGPERPSLRDLVLSCRVAQKRVEHTFLQWLALREAARGKSVLSAELVRTDRNKPMLQVFDDLRFMQQAQRNGCALMELRLDQSTTVSDIIAVEADGELQTAR